MKYLKIFVDFADTMEALDDAERGRLFTAMLCYAKAGEAPMLTGNEQFLWPAARQQLDRMAEQYQKTCAVNAANAGKKSRQDTASQEAVTVRDVMPIQEKAEPVPSSALVKEAAAVPGQEAVTVREASVDLQEKAAPVPSSEPVKEAAAVPGPSSAPVKEAVPSPAPVSIPACAPVGLPSSGTVREKAAPAREKPDPVMPETLPVRTGSEGVSGGMSSIGFGDILKSINGRTPPALATAMANAKPRAPYPPPPMEVLPLKNGEDYFIYAGKAEEWARQFPNANISGELRKMRDWLTAHPERAMVKKDIVPFILRWLEKANKTRSKPAAQKPTSYDLDEIKQFIFENSMG